MARTDIIVRPMGPLVAALSRYSQQLFQPPRDTIRGIEPDTWYSPLQPVKPIAPEGVEPRGFQYWAGQNLLWTPRADAELSAADLKQLAAYPLARIAIENVKDAMTKASWEVQPRPEPGESRKAARKRGAGDKGLVKVSRFFERPDREHDWPFWLRPLLEDMLVIDAWTILIRKTFKGEIVELPVIRGESIVRYIDANGFTPLPPEPAYAQNWWGIPLVNLTTDQLVYKPRNIVPRNTIASQLYGMSPTEQLAEEIQIGQARLAFIKAYYTEGSIPGVVHVVPRGTSPDKISEAMQWMNSELAGNLSARRQWRMVQGFNEPGKPDQIEYTKEPLLADAFDDLHIKKIFFGYGVSPQRVMKQMNRASAQASQEAADIEGLLPYFASLKSVMDCLIQQKMGYADYEWVPDPFVEPDPEKEAERVKILVAGGIITPNEGREKIGEEAYADPVADELGVITGSGFVPIGQTAAQPAAGGAGGDVGGKPDGKGKTNTDDSAAGDGTDDGADGGVDRGGKKPRTVREQRADKPNGGKLALRAQGPQVQRAEATIGFTVGSIDFEKYVENQPRVPAGSPEGGEFASGDGGEGSDADKKAKRVAKALDRWVGAEGAEGIQQESKDYIRSGFTEKVNSDGAVLVRAVAESPKTDYVIWRGTNDLPEGMTPTKGAEFDMDRLQSFTPDKENATMFGEDYMIKINAGGAQALHVQTYVPGLENEYIVAGRMRVTSVVMNTRGLTTITIKQVGVFHPSKTKLEKYADDQPREPAGSPEGGQFAGGMGENKALDDAKQAWDDDRTATAISRQSESLVKTGKASGANGAHAGALLDELGKTKAESHGLYRGLRSYDLKNLGTLKKGFEFGVTGLKSFSSVKDIAESYGQGRPITVLSLTGKSRTLNLPDASVPGGERLTNGRFKVTRITEDTGWSDTHDRNVTIRTVEVKQLGIYGRKR